MIDVFHTIDTKNPDVMQALRIAFEAGRRRGRDERKGPDTYEWERSVPEFGEWYEQATQERKESE